MVWGCFHRGGGGVGGVGEWGREVLANKSRNRSCFWHTSGMTWWPAPLMRQGAEHAAEMSILYSDINGMADQFKTYTFWPLHVCKASVMSSIYMPIQWKQWYLQKGISGLAQLNERISLKFYQMSGWSRQMKWLQEWYRCATKGKLKRNSKSLSEASV